MSGAHFDKWAFAGRRTKAVSATRRQDGTWDTTGLAFSDFSKMHVQRREKTQERRLPTPRWAVRDDLLRELLVTYLEERFYCRPAAGLTLMERLNQARCAAEFYAPRKRELLEAWLYDYHVISLNGRADLSDEKAIEIFCSLKQVKGQLPLDADVAREYLASKKLHDLEIQIQNVDTDIVLTARGHAEIIAAVVYLYYRMGYDSVTVAELLALKSPHVRQVLARLHATARDTLSQRIKDIVGDESSAMNPSSSSGPEGAASSPISEQPLDAIFGDAVPVGATNSSLRKGNEMESKMVQTPEQIIQCAKELHDSYRAAFKALSDKSLTLYYRMPTYPAERHDHGFISCTRRGKAYFLRRAVRVLKDRNRPPTPF